MRLPDYPIEGQPIRRSWGVAIVDYLRAITPQPSGSSIRINTGPGGTTFTAHLQSEVDEAAVVADRMFDLVQASATEVAVRAGLWIRRRPGGTYRPALTVDSASPSSDPDDVKTLSGFAASKTYDIYVDLDARSPTALSAGFAEAPVFVPPTRRMILGQVVTNGDAEIESLTQWRPGGVIVDALAADHAWLFDPTSATGGDLVAGSVYIGGVGKTVSGPVPASLSGVTTTTKYWVKIDFQNATAAWESGAAVPANTAVLEHWHVLTLTCAGNVITGVDQPWTNDIRALLNP